MVKQPDQAGIQGDSMIPLKPFLTDINSVLHVGSPYKAYTSPEIYINYWSTGIKTIDFINQYGPIEKIDLQETRSFSGRFCFKRYYLDPYIYIDLIKGPKTESTKTDIIPIICPKVRSGINTRWNGSKGLWEKQLKKGWCTA